MKPLSKWAVLALVIALSTPAVADYLEVSRAATIKSDPHRDAMVYERVQPGTLLDLLNDGEQDNGYYRVHTLTYGQPGWIYRTLVRRRPGDMPGAVPTAEATDPLLDATLSLSPEERSFAARHLRIGKPQAIHERAREGYVLGHDARLKVPLWVQYEVTREDLQGTIERTDDFRPDTSIPYGSRAELGDYEGSGFDRGHLAPAADMVRDERVMRESFLLSNMAPQVGVGFNRQMWRYLEAAVRGWVQQRGTLTVITGSVFAADGGRVSFDVVGENEVAVPTGFYKIVVDTTDPEQVEALAFLLPNEAVAGSDYGHFLVSIDDVEAVTGLDFLSALPAEVQLAVEADAAPQVW